MSSINDGGSAFPCQQGFLPDGTWNQSFDPGMTLRDWFAGQALSGLCANGIPGPHHRNAALDAYAYADAILAERAKARGEAP